LTQFSAHIERLSSSPEECIQIFLDCEGRDLGRIGGKLGLVQLGLEEEVYLIDVISYPESLVILKGVLENPKFEKVVWDGRSDYCELWFGHGIAMGPLIDLQLVRVYESCRGIPGSAGYINLEGMARVFERAPHAVRRDSGIVQSTFERGINTNKVSLKL
jgi:ribonuclease D